MDSFNAEYKRANAIIDKTKEMLNSIKNHKKYNEQLKPVYIGYKSTFKQFNIDEVIEILLTEEMINYRD